MYLRMNKEHAEIVLRQRKHYSTDTVQRAIDFLNSHATDQKTVAERQWQKSRLAPVPQKPCDHGLFSDEKDQLDLI